MEQIRTEPIRVAVELSNVLMRHGCSICHNGGNEKQDWMAVADDPAGNGPG